MVYFVKFINFSGINTKFKKKIKKPVEINPLVRYGFNVNERKSNIVRENTKLVSF